MEYLGITFRYKSIESKEILNAILDTEGFEGVNEENDLLMGFVASEECNINILQEIFESYNIDDEIEIVSQELFPDKNWNEEWERSFEPIIINEKCVVRAPFHSSFKEYPYVITIEPKMSFGTGHHETTRLMIIELFNLDIKNKKVLDMGSGTGVLAILTAKFGASEVTAIDNDKWAFENCKENTKSNNVEFIKVLLGGKEIIPKTNFDVIIANINRNILIDQLDSYKQCMAANSVLLLSGILKTDFDFMNERLIQCGLQTEKSESLNKWGLLKVRLSS